MISEDRWGLSFPDICHTVEENLRKKPQPGKLTRPRIEPGSARWETSMLPFDHSSGLLKYLIYMYFNFHFLL